MRMPNQGAAALRCWVFHNERSQSNIKHLRLESLAASSSRLKSKRSVTGFRSSGSKPIYPKRKWLNGWGLVISTFERGNTTNSSLPKPNGLPYRKSCRANRACRGSNSAVDGNAGFCTVTSRL